MGQNQEIIPPQRPGSLPATIPPPSVTALVVTSNPKIGDTYGADDVIRISVTLSETMDVMGAPQLKIDMDPAEWGEKWASYASGSGTTTLVFAHTVVEPNISTQGIAVLANTLELNGGTIRSDGLAACLPIFGWATTRSTRWTGRTDRTRGGLNGRRVA